MIRPVYFSALFLLWFTSSLFADSPTNPEDQYALGDRYYYGDDRIVSDFESIDARYFVGMLYLEGKRVPKDIERGKRQLGWAAKAGHAEAKAKLIALQ